MKAAVLLLLAVAAAEISDEPWVEEEDLEEPYNEGSYRDDEPRERTRREAYVEDPYEEHIRVKRRCDDEPVHRDRRSYPRVPRQVHQYEVYEFTDDDLGPSSAPYEEMLASANQYHRVYAVPGAPAPARYSSPDVSHSVNVASQPYAAVVVPNQPLAPSNPTVNNQKFHSSPVQFVASPIASVSSPVGPILGGVPIIPGPVSQPLQKLADGDLFGAAAGHHHHKHGHGHTQGGGHARQGKHYAEHGGKTHKGFNTDHYLDKGAKGYNLDEKHRKEYEEAAGKKRKHHDNADHKGSHEEEAHGHRGSHFGEKKGHKKGHKTKGYHNKYHKDEFHKEHKFYDDYHKSGEHHRYGKFNAKHASNESGKKKAHHVNAGHDFVERGKKGYSNKGHVDADHKGYNGKNGHEEHHEHHTEHGKKGGKDGGSQWGYQQKH